MSLTLIADIRSSLEQVPYTIHGIPTGDWSNKHLFYNASQPIGTGAMNRGRCPFVRYFRTGKEYDHQSNAPRGGKLTSDITLEIVTSHTNVKSQEDNYAIAYEIWNSFREDLRAKANYLIGNDRILEMQINPMLFVLQCTIQVENSF